MRFRTAGFLCAAIVWAGAAQAQDVRATIEASNKAFVAAFAKHDAKAIGEFYTSTAQAFPPNSDVIRGRAAIVKMWDGVFASGVAAAELKTTEVQTHGTSAYETGTYVMKLKDGKVADQGKYVVVWMQEDGKWKLHRDIWNTSLPAAPPPGSKK
jgi:uncharacterized protein (TIGR02246 family)